MIESYQEAAALEPVEPQEASFATIGTIYADGVSLIFDGEEEPTAKHYRCNRSVVFHTGDRVRIIKDSGTYIVEYPVGAPLGQLNADYAVQAGTANSANNATNATTAVSATKHTGSSLSFFSAASGSTKRNVAALSGSPNVTTVANKVNELLTALKAYSLIG